MIYILCFYKNVIKKKKKNNNGINLIILTGKINSILKEFKKYMHLAKHMIQQSVCLFFESLYIPTKTIDRQRY